MLPPIRDVVLDRRLTPSEKDVYLTLRYVPEFRLSPSEWKPAKHEALSKLLDISESTVARSIASLIQRGYLEAGTRKPGSPQEYRLVFSRKVA